MGKGLYHSYLEIQDLVLKIWPENVFKDGTNLEFLKKGTFSD
jgi:hypothetical protein